MSQPPEFLQQYTALTRGAGLAELLGRTILSVTGADRVQILQSFTTNDIKRLTPGQGCEAFVTSPQGKTLGHVLIFCEEQQHGIDTTPGQAQTLIDHFNRYVITEDAVFTDQSSELVDLLVAGREAAALLAKFAGNYVPNTAYGHSTVQIAEQPVTIRRVEYAGTNSFFLQVTAASAKQVASALQEAGATPCDPAAVESARLEAGYPLFGTDITAENLPQEVNRDSLAISFKKGCYLGQETVARIDAIGHVNRLLVGIKFSGPAIPATNEPVLAAGQQVGHITSAAWSPRLQAPLALAYVKRNHAKSGSSLEIASDSGTVISLPLAESA
jgi:folate-binding protein YgfZ